MKGPKISVIMPVYNTPCEYLVEAVQSVLNQTYKNFELIIIDDGSNSKTKAVLKSFNDKRIILLHNEHNLGLIYSLNMGLQNASGTYIARMDSDDISFKNRFKKQVEFMENNPEIGVLGAAITIFGKRNQDDFPPEEDTEIRQGIVSCTTSLLHPTVMIRASILGDIKYNPEYIHAEDLGLWIALFDKTKFANLPEVLLKYRWHGNNISKKYAVLQSLTVQKLMFQNLHRFYGKNTSEQLRIVEKLKSKKSISTKEFKLLFDFSDIAEPNRQFVRTARACCSNLFVKIGLIA